MYQRLSLLALQACMRYIRLHTYGNRVAFDQTDETPFQSVANAFIW